MKDVDRLKERRDPGRFDFYKAEEAWALVRAAESEQDAAIFLTATFGGLRMGECLALRCPMVEPVAQALARLAQREHFTARDDLVFPGVVGSFLDGSALRRRYKAAAKRADLRPLRFHDLRHTFGTLAINHASLVQAQHWMGHADIQTTSKYLHYRSRAGEAKLLAEAFRVRAPAGEAAPV